MATFLDSKRSHLRLKRSRSRNFQPKRRAMVVAVALVSLLGAVCSVGAALTWARADGGTIGIAQLIDNPDSSDGHGKLIRADGGQVAYCVQGALGYPQPGQTLERYGSLGIPELDYVVYHGYDGKIVTSLEGLNERKSESATMAAIWLAVADQRPDVLNFIPKFEEPFHGNRYYYQRWNAIKDQGIKTAAWNLYQAGLAYKNAGGGGIEEGCAIVWLNRNPGGTNQTFIYQCIATSNKQVRVTLNKTSAKSALTDGNNEYALEGATYEVYSEATGEKVAAATTDETGRATLTLQPNTKYYAVEVKAPKGYALSSEKVSFTTSELETFVSVADQPKTITLKIRKTDAATGGTAQTGCSLAGAEYEVTSDSTPGFCITVTTDENGTASLAGLPLGNFHVRETKAPAGYLLDETVHTYHAGADDLGSDDVITISTDDDFAETPIAFDIEISKFMGEDGDGSKIEAPVEGISFEIISQTTGKAVGTITTDKDGHASSKNEWFGQGSRPENANGSIPYDAAGYAVHEVPESIPEGLSPVDDWNIDAAQQMDGVSLRYIVNNEVKTSRLQIVKVDAQTNERIKLARFTFQLLDGEKQPVSQDVWYPSHERIDTFTTDDDGSVMLPEALKAGTYYVRETSVQAPYLLCSEDVVVKIDGDEPVAVVTVEDDCAQGTATITKTCSADASAIEGVEYDVRAAAEIPGIGGHETIPKGTVVGHVTTDSDGVARIKGLYLGDGEANYEFVETKTTAGHVLDATPIPFTLSYQDQTTATVFAVCKASNDANELVIRKLADNEKQTTVEGAKFIIWRLEDEVTETTELSEQIADANAEPTLKEGTEPFRIVTDANGAAKLPHLAAGTWRIRESKAPAGYILDPTTHEIIVDESGLIEGKASYELTLKNDFTKIDISKRDITDESELEGAKLTVTDKDGNVIDSWTSTTEPHRIEAIAPGTYTLTEEQAPKGHDKTESVEFTVEETGEVQSVAMYDSPIEISGDVDKRQQRLETAGAGREVVYSIDMRSTSNTWVDECTVTDDLTCATAGLATLESITTPRVNGDFDGKLNVWYHTTLTESQVNDSGANATMSDGHENPWLKGEGRCLDYSHWRIWKEGVSTSSAETLDVSSLDLADGEVVDSIRFEFGCVDETFSSRSDSWDRKDLKVENDTLASIDSSGNNLSPAIVHLKTTAAFTSNIDIDNSATLDLFRNGGGGGLEDHDDDHVVQKVVQQLAQTGVDSFGIPLLASTICCGLAMLVYAARSSMRMIKP